MKALQYVQVLLLIAGIAYLAWFHFVNPAFGVAFPVPFMGVFSTFSSIALLGAFLLGLLYAALLFIPHSIRRSNTNRRMARRIKDLEAENLKLRPASAVPMIPDREADMMLEDLRQQGKV